MRRRLPRDYSAQQLERGRGMTCHPVCGMPLVECVYDPQRQRFFRVSVLDGCRYALDRIGDGRDHDEGDRYPRHWNYDPYTGERLKPLKPCPPCGGWVMD